MLKVNSIKHNPGSTMRSGIPSIFQCMADFQSSDLVLLSTNVTCLRPEIIKNSRGRKEHRRKQQHVSCDVRRRGRKGKVFFSLSMETMKFTKLGYLARFFVFENFQHAPDFITGFYSHRCRDTKSYPSSIKELQKKNSLFVDFNLVLVENVFMYKCVFT
jgi:hypothetical protein